MKKMVTGIIGLLALFTLAGCGNHQLTVGATTKKPSGMVAVIKGKTNKGAKLSYQISGQSKKTVKNTDGAYIIEVPAKTKDQKVTVTSKDGTNVIHKKVIVKKTKALGNYKKVANSYNQAVIGMSLSKSTQQKAKQLAQAQQKAKTAGTQTSAAKAKAAIAKLPAAEQKKAVAKLKAQQKQMQALQQEAKEVQSAMATAKKKNQDKLLPTSLKNGVQNVITQKNYTVRANYQDQNLMGLTLIVPTKAMKNKDRQKDFGTTFALLTTEVGAKPKSVMKQFAKFQKDAKNSTSTSTATHIIKSNGVKFQVGYSTTHLYIYITK
ncbi:hypothetical protein [Pediococcus cellicola]|uniref:Lipoprotein n=1 Tax=Pediococcus cellicola TaxID=319652 RepID=A0A0R2IKN6_9LACO|nr:hypothetical protein [Pediococcus cellicola]KRN65599.1 hypothetical protein IV80_GL001881 [Pediococcus cellicola]GEL15640.1 lipoprotein [Pediococcus cellicola]